MKLAVGDKMRLLKPDLFTDDEDREIPVPAGTMGRIAAIDERPTCTIYEIHWDNNTFSLFSPEEDGLEFVERVS